MCDFCRNKKFQSTLPRRERPFFSFSGFPLLQFQSTLPRRERPCVVPSPKSSAVISIHAPAKGATHLQLTVLPDVRISIHAPAKGATYRTTQKLRELQFQSTLPRRERRGSHTNLIEWISFQSTLPRRERPCIVSTRTGEKTISIHAPAKGATQNRSRGLYFLQFQSTLPRRERQITELYKMARILFQSTLPRRERRYNGKPDLPLLYNFNPRSREGSDTKQNE